jgi:hypothetical protein
MNKLYDQVELCKKNHESFEKEIDCEFLGSDDNMYPAKAKLIIENDGLFYVSYYNYFLNGKWVSTEERQLWTEDEIEKSFFD